MVWAGAQLDQRLRCRRRHVMDDDERERLELDLELAVSGERLTVRRDCAFCGRERSKKDDNHAPDCPYWDFFPPS